MRILFSLLSLVFIISAALAAPACTTSTHSLATTLSSLNVVNNDNYVIVYKYEPSTSDKIEISADVCTTANVALNLDVINGAASLVITTFAATTTVPPPVVQPNTTTTSTTPKPTLPGNTVNQNSAARMNPLSSLFVVLIPLFFINRRLSIIFALLVVALSLQVSHAESATQITITIKYPRTLRQVCVGDICKQFSIGAEYYLGTNKYIALDGTSPYSATASACQTGYHAIPSGWSLAKADEIKALAAVGAFPTTTCFVGVSAFDQSGDACSSEVDKKTVEGLGDFYGTGSKCGRIILSMAQPAARLAEFNIGMKVLVLSVDTYVTDLNAADGALVLANTMLRAAGVPFDLVPLKDTTKQDSPLNYPGDKDLPLFDEEGRPKYYAIVITTDVVENALPTGASVLSDAQRAQLKLYRTLYGVRTVYLNTDQRGAGFSREGQASDAGFFVGIDPTFAAKSENAYMFNGLKKTAMFDTKGVYYRKVKVGLSSAVSVARIYNSAKADTGYSMGAIQNDIANDGGETMQWFAGHSISLDYSPFLANVWINWVTKGVFVGSRRIFLSPQIDDLFLSTEEWPSTTKKNRMTPADLTSTVTYLSKLNTLRAPANSNITLEFGFNNAEAEVNGAGSKPSEKNTQLRDAVLANVGNFFWESHTWSHLDLSCYNSDAVSCKDQKAAGTMVPTTYDDCNEELYRNNDYTRNTLFASIGGLDADHYSRDCMITPKISGLFNKNALKALVDNGYNCVVGDNSVPELQQKNPYQGEWTDEDVHGYEGVFIIPRHATEIYYNCAEVACQETQFNSRYGLAGTITSLGKDFTLEEIMAREAATTVRWMGQYRHDPYMFHQSNLVRWTYSRSSTSQVGDGKWSHITLWLDHVMDAYNEVYTFPIVTIPHKYLRNQYLFRRERDACGADPLLVVRNGAKVSVELSSTGSCNLAVTGITCNAADSNCKKEIYGDDVTAWAQISSSHSVSLEASGSW